MNSLRNLSCELPGWPQNRYLPGRFLPGFSPTCRCFSWTLDAYPKPKAIHAWFCCVKRMFLSNCGIVKQRGIFDNMHVSLRQRPKAIFGLFWTAQRSFEDKTLVLRSQGPPTEVKIGKKRENDIFGVKKMPSWVLAHLIPSPNKDFVLREGNQMLQKAHLNGSKQDQKGIF